MRTFVSLFIVFSIVSCANHSVNSDISKVNSNSDSFPLPDSLFAFKNIKNSRLVSSFYYDPKDYHSLYSDSTKTKKLIYLDSTQKLKIIIPIMMADYGYQRTGGIDSNYIMKLVSARFVSKQNKIGKFTPIIVWINGDDYEALTYILLDDSLKPISHLILYGGLCAGPLSETDTSLELCPVTQSFLNESKISSYIIKESAKKAPKTPSTIDSINYLNTILPSGQIETKRLDSTRYKRMPIWQKNL
ncbi:MAG TPA: hypothetical protein VK806_03855 [Bacteroidia bacterium]|jgi:hypothetical protein|nr:hypothetical protein [Bacteroidia bacterium]